MTTTIDELARILRSIEDTNTQGIRPLSVSEQVYDVVIEAQLIHADIDHADLPPWACAGDDRDLRNRVQQLLTHIHDMEDTVEARETRMQNELDEAKNALEEVRENLAEEIATLQLAMNKDEHVFASKIRSMVQEIRELRTWKETHP